MLIARNMKTTQPVQVFVAMIFALNVISTISIGATFMKLASLSMGIVITFLGHSFSANKSQNKFDGTAQGISIEDIDNPSKNLLVTLPTDTSVKALNEAADSISGRPNPGNVTKIENLMQPKGSPFPDLTDTGHSGKDTMKGFRGDDTLNGKGGSDHFYASRGSDIINGGGGKDTYDASFFTIGITADLTKGTAKLGRHDAKLTGVENIIGTKASDILKGNGGHNVLSGGDNPDIIKGRGGDDRLLGGKGADNIDGGKGFDTIIGGPGNDQLTGGPGRDTFVFSGKKNAKNGSDTITDFAASADKIKIQGGSLKGVKVTKDGSDTIVKFDQGTIRLENTDLTKSKIDFVF